MSELNSFDKIVCRYLYIHIYRHICVHTYVDVYIYMAQAVWVQVASAPNLERSRGARRMPLVRTVVPDRGRIPRRCHSAHSRGSSASPQQWHHSGAGTQRCSPRRI